MKVLKQVIIILDIQFIGNEDEINYQNLNQYDDVNRNLKIMQKDNFCNPLVKLKNPLQFDSTQFIKSINRFPFLSLYEKLHLTGKALSKEREMTRGNNYHYEGHRNRNLDKLNFHHMKNYSLSSWQPAKNATFFPINCYSKFNFSSSSQKSRFRVVMSKMQSLKHELLINEANQFNVAQQVKFISLLKKILIIKILV